MKKEVPPWIAIVGLILTLTIVWVVYWHGLLGGGKLNVRPPGGGAGGGGGAGEEVVQTGPAVTTVAGRPQPGYADGSAVEALFNGPSGIAVDSAGSMYIADSRNHRIRKIAGGSVTTLAGGGAAGYEDGPALRARFSSPAGVALAQDGGLFVADTGNHRIRRITAGGEVSTYAGSETPKDDIGRFSGGRRDGPAAQAQFCYPVGLAVDAGGAVFVADSGNHSVRRIAGGEVGTIPVGGGEMEAPTEVALVGDRLWVSDTGKGILWTGPKDGPLAPWRLPAKQKGPKAPSGLVAIGESIYVADSGNHSIYRITAGNVSPVAGHSGSPAYADGRGAGASFSFPAAIAAAPGVGLYVADFGNNCIREVKLSASEEGR
jgi:sugar lactone lactonase YvrE